MFTLQTPFSTIEVVSVNICSQCFKQMQNVLFVGDAFSYFFNILLHLTQRGHR